MTKIFLSSTILFLSLIMYFLIHPLSMGLMILLQTLLTCLLTGMMIKTYWFSYILFLTFLGGLLVLFIYVSSIASNELFNFNLKMKIFFLIFMCLSFISMIFYMNNLKWMNFNANNSEMMSFFNFNMFNNNNNKINLNKLYNSQTMMLTLILIIYLFITLIAMVKITNISYGPLRSNF